MCVCVRARVMCMCVCTRAHVRAYIECMRACVCFKKKKNCARLGQLLSRSEVMFRTVVEWILSAVLLSTGKKERRGLGCTTSIASCTSPSQRRHVQARSLPRETPPGSRQKSQRSKTGQRERSGNVLLFRFGHACALVSSCCCYCCCCCCCCCCYCCCCCCCYAAVAFPS